MSLRSITSVVASRPAIVPAKVDEVSIFSVPVEPANITVPLNGELIPVP